MNRIKFTQIICSIFPPVISQSLRKYLYPRKLGIKKKTEFTKKSITGSYLTSTSEDFHGYSFLFHGFFDWRNVIIANSIFKENDGDIIEIGANIGTETVSFCDIASNLGTVHAFEPLPENFEKLKKLKRNHNNLILYKNAISDKEKEVYFNKPPVTSSGTGRIIIDNCLNDDSLIKVKAIKLANRHILFNNVKLISIDTEGHEKFVLNGSEDIIIKHRPFVIIEVNPKLLSKYANSSPACIYRFFKEKKYLIYKINRLFLNKINYQDLSTHKDSNWICTPIEQKSTLKVIRKDIFFRSIIPWYLLKKLPEKLR